MLVGGVVYANEGRAGTFASAPFEETRWISSVAGRVRWSAGSIESKEWGARPIRSWSMRVEVTVCSGCRASGAESGLQDSKAYLPGRGDTMITKVVFPGRGSPIALGVC